MKHCRADRQKVYKRQATYRRQGLSPHEWESEAGEAPPSGRGPSPRMPPTASSQAHRQPPDKHMDSLQSKIWTDSKYMEPNYK